MEALEKTRFYSVRSEPVRKLDGFESYHDVPTVVNHRSLEWLDRLTHTRLDSAIDSVFDSLRRCFGLKRRQLSVHGPVQRHAVIETPFFNFEASVELDERNPEQVLWNSEINQIRNVESVISEAFDSCFSKIAWNLEVSVNDALDLAEIVDRIEEKDAPGFVVEYDKDLKWCEIRIPDCQATLRATTDSFNVCRPSDSSPRQLLSSLVQFQNHLVDQIGPFRLQKTGNTSGP